MGKYQLDDKGKAQVQRFHEKHSQGGSSKKRTISQTASAIFRKEQETIEVRVGRKAVSLSSYQEEVWS